MKVKRYQRKAMRKNLHTKYGDVRCVMCGKTISVGMSYFGRISKPYCEQCHFKRYIDIEDNDSSYVWTTKDSLTWVLVENTISAKDVEELDDYLLLNAPVD